jgi:hypothetical protein
VAQAFTATDAAPVTTPVSNTILVATNEFAATSLFTAADADSDSIVQYDFWNSGTGGGRWLLKGNPLGIGQDNLVPAAQLAQVTYKAGNGPDMIWERASDGLQFGAWSPAVPIVNAPNPVHSAFTISHLHTVAATTLFTASDGDALTQYDFWDTGTGGGHWVIKGQPGVINGDNIVSAAQLPQVSYQSGTGTDTLWIRVNDGTGFGPWSQAFTATDTAPVTTPVSNTILTATNETFAAANLFTSIDSDMDPNTQYDFWDNGAGGGHWLINGVAGNTGADNFVNAANLSQVTYQAGSGTDTLWVRANDGLQWGAWSTAFTATGGAQTQQNFVTIPAGGSVEIGPASSDVAIFAGKTGTLKLDNSASFFGTVAGMTGQDTIDFADIDPSKVQRTSFSGNSSGGMLTVTDGMHTANIALLGNYLASIFVPSSDGHGGTTVVDPQVLGGVQPLITPPHS